MVTRSEPLLPLLITGNMLSPLDDGKMGTVHPVNPLLPQEVGPDLDEGDPTSVQPSHRRGQGRGKKAHGRRPGAIAAASKSKGEEEEQIVRREKKRKGRKRTLCDILCISGAS